MSVMSALVIAELEEIEQEIEAAEGPHHVEGRFYANAFDAQRQRLAAAERRLRDRLRAASRVGTIPLEPETPFDDRCALCEHAFDQGDPEPIVRVAGRLVHGWQCADEYAAVTADALVGVER